MSKKPGTFQKGNPGGPGRPKMPEELKAVKSLTKTMVEKVIAKYSTMSLEELRVAAANEKLPTMEHMVIAVALKAVEEADHKRTDFLLDRSVGKVKEVKELVIAEPTYIERPDGAVIELGMTLIEGSDE